MHEFGIAGEIVSAAVEEARRRNAERITAVTVRVGVLRGVEPESLRLFYDHLTRGTLAESAVLVVEEDPVLVDCGACGEVPGEKFSLACPSCGVEGVRVRGGDSLRIVSIDIDP